MPSVSKERGQHGGKRPGAGRKPGTRNALGYGEVKALKVARLRVPEDAPEDHARLADKALETMVDVMLGEVGWQEAGPRLKAATLIRAEVCGPVPQKLQHSGADGEPLAITINRTVKK